MTLLNSIIGGGVGTDRFYLDQIWSGFLKLLTAGGFGVWTIIDIIYVWIGHLQPLDGSLYIDYNDWMSVFDNVFNLG